LNFGSSELGAVTHDRVDDVVEPFEAWSKDLGFTIFEMQVALLTLERVFVQADRLNIVEGEVDGPLADEAIDLIPVDAQFPTPEDVEIFDIDEAGAAYDDEEEAGGGEQIGPGLGLGGGDDDEEEWDDLDDDDGGEGALDGLDIAIVGEIPFQAGASGVDGSTLPHCGDIRAGKAWVQSKACAVAGDAGGADIKRQTGGRPQAGLGTAFGGT